MSRFASHWIVWIAILLAVRSAQAIINNTRFDYVILGGGTAGLVVASRLSEDPKVTVAVIEAGDFERNNPNVTNITQLGIAKNTRIDWQYESVPQVYGGNKTVVWSAGKGVGGSSLINGMTYMRPASSQIDLWPSLGLELGWAELSEFSKKGEHFQPPSAALTALGASFEPRDHGFRGPLTTCISPHMTAGNIHNVFHDTFKNLGIPPRAEFNGGDLHGFGVQQVTQNGRADVREDAARAYYYPVMDRQNLVVIANTTATRIIWASNGPDGNAIASAAEVVGQGDRVSVIYATRELILSAGAIRSPAILEHSGVGNPSILSRYSIPVKVALPAVGENLQDQTTIAVTSLVPGQNFTGFAPFVAHASLQDLFGNNASDVYADMLAALPSYADTIASQNGGGSSASAQLALLKSQLDLLRDSNTPTAEFAPIAIGGVVFVVFWPLQPFSRGSVHVASANRTAPPAVDGRFFQFAGDGALAVASARFARRVLGSAPLSELVNQTSIDPPLGVEASDAEWLGWIKERSGYAPNFHHLGTCAMLPRDMGGVVDNGFRVYGTANVRVVDMSVVPVQVAGHSTALLYGVAEWAAEKIKRS